MKPIVKVACNGCKACCQNELLILHPDLGDVIDDYETKQAINPLTGEACLALRQKPNGDCFYLGEEGCTIHGHHPATCRKFDCAAMALAFFALPRPERRRYLKAGFLDETVLAAGKARLAKNVADA
jgi:hypothetical protein